MSDLDDAAAAALWRFARAEHEHIGLLYEHDGLHATPTQTTERHGEVSGSFRIPRGSLRAMFHNHPERNHRAKGTEGHKDADRSQFSGGDRRQARGLGVPSYIGAGHTVLRYDPQTKQTTEVLAQVPIEEIRSRVRRFSAEDADAARRLGIRAPVVIDIDGSAGGGAMREYPAGELRDRIEAAYHNRNKRKAQAPR